MTMLSLSEARAKLDGGSTTATALVEATFAKIEETAELGAFVRLHKQRALDDAARFDRAPQPGLLAGIPVAVKDNILTDGEASAACSKILEGYEAPYDSTVASKLKAAGAIIVGKTNMDEFGMGSSSEHSPAGPVRNPHDTERVAGGSSGGSAVSVAAGQVFGALGTDTGGSVRQPAALTGVYGLKPTYGRVSRYGVVAFGSSLDQVGTFARSPEDLARLTQSIAGFDARDATSIDHPVPDYLAATGTRDLQGLKVGVPEAFFGHGLNPDVELAVRETIAELETLGARLVPVSMPHTQYALATYYLIATAEASSNLSRYDGVRYGRRASGSSIREMVTRTRHEGFGDEVKRRIILGTFVLSAGYYDAYYGRAQKVRTLIRQDYERAFDTVDILVTPTSPFPAFPIASRTEDPLSMYLADVMTVSASLAGTPALNIPAKRQVEGLPVGVQAIAPWFAESRLFEIAGALQTADSSTDRLQGS